jgi:hypothetical protein
MAGDLSNCWRNHSEPRPVYPIRGNLLAMAGAVTNQSSSDVEAEPSNVEFAQPNALRHRIQSHGPANRRAGTTEYFSRSWVKRQKPIHRTEPGMWRLIAGRQVALPRGASPDEIEERELV